MMPNGENLVFEEILLRDPPPLRIQHQRVPTDLIDFDQDNPRLRYAKELYPDKSDSQLLFEGASDTAWLQKDIKEKGLIDPIYVRKVGDRYVVVEGNRRTACMKALLVLEPDNPRFMVMPARILPEQTTEDQTALLMASFHVAGKLKWDAHEKAGHIYHMLNVLHIPEQEMSTILHMAVPTLKRIALSYQILEETYGRIDGAAYAAQKAGKWSFFAEMLRIKPLRLERDRDPAGWDAKFSRWVGEGRIPNAANVRDLAEILRKARSRHLFENEPAAEAFAKAQRASNETNPANISKLFKQLEKTLATVGEAQLNDINLANENDAARVMLTDTYQALGSLMERAGVRVPGPRRTAA